MVTEKSQLDGRPKCAPSHWNEYFRIYYLTEKMRSQKDPYFSDISDRVRVGRVTKEDIDFFNSRVLPCASEDSNESFRLGRLCIIVTTNSKKDLINNEKLEQLLPNQKEYNCNSIDRVVNLPVDNVLPSSLNENATKTGNLQTVLKLKLKAPVVVTINHSKRKYREDGIVNGDLSI